MHQAWWESGVKELIITILFYRCLSPARCFCTRAELQQGVLSMPERKDLCPSMQYMRSLNTHDLGMQGLG